MHSVDHLLSRVQQPYDGLPTADNGFAPPGQEAIAAVNWELYSRA
jgi:hypothetical protein